jgi:hypothetical protein
MMVGREMQLTPAGTGQALSLQNALIVEILEGQARPIHDRGIFTGMKDWNLNIVFK